MNSARFSDPAPAASFSHLDATTVLSRAIAEQGIYPAVDPLDSTSRILQPGVELQVQLQPGRSEGEVQFEFKAGDFVVSCGRLWFGGRC